MIRFWLDDREEQWTQLKEGRTLPFEIKLPDGRQTMPTSNLAKKDFKRLTNNRNHFYDAVICVDNVQFPVDRNVMACCSPYFRALFAETKPSSAKTNNEPNKVQIDRKRAINTNQSSRSRSEVSVQAFNGPKDDILVRARSTLQPLFAEPSLPGQMPSQVAAALSDRRQTSQLTSPEGSRPPLEYTITGVTSDVMNDIIEHAYGGDVIITNNNFDSLLIGADRFQVASLLTKCCRFLETQLSKENCISIVKFVSNFFHCEKTKLKGTQYFLDNFTEVARISPDFYSLTVEELTSVLTADRLNVRHEEEVLDAVIRWVMAGREDRKQHITCLVACARIGLMLPDNINAFVNTWLQSSNDVTMQVMESVLEQQKQQMLHVDVSMFSPRLPRDVLLVVGGSNFGYPLNVVEAYDCRTRLWSIITPHDFAPRSYHGMVTVDNDMFVLGGFSGQEYLSSCVKFQPETLAWEHVTPMNAKRCYVGAAALLGDIYAVGGYDGTHRLNSAEKFSRNSNQWSYISPMLQQRSDAGVAVLNDKLYVCGGFNGTECIHAVEIYDPLSDQWSALAAMVQGRSGLGLVAYKECLYAVGGFDGVDSSVRLRTAEVYVPTSDEWWALASMPSPRSNLAVEVLEDVLYTIGGYNGERTTAVVEGYDFATNSWFECPRLSHNRSALSVGLVRGLSNTAELLGRQAAAHGQGHQGHPGASWAGYNATY